MEQFDNIDEYIADLKAKLQANPSCGNTHYNLGVAYLSRRDFVEAEREFLDAVAHSPRMAEGYVQLGGIALQRNDLESCLNYNIQATQQRPFFAVPWGNIGFVLMQQGDNDKAHKALKKALKLDPEFAQAQATMSSLLISMGDYVEADKLLKTILEKYPNFGPAWNNKAIVDAHNGNWDDAAKCITKAEESGFDVPDEFKAEILENTKQELFLLLSAIQCLSLWDRQCDGPFFSLQEQVCPVSVVPKRRSVKSWPPKTGRPGSRNSKNIVQATSCRRC
eukprot:TRINITY_DN9949_c0_g1_i3.p2 TRINITY_DN9949_c0_g1~~TRINITY_DN9949_c0_g1_i3.p2  ORF type:complete len:278 (+),score=61.04 TRINITY_DN9949_c0_g1_i3:809-1642(+)